jgi:hypothetical protein
MAQSHAITSVAGESSAGGGVRRRPAARTQAGATQYRRPMIIQRGGLECPFMAILHGVKCARCRIFLQGSGDAFSCPQCGVRDTRAGIDREIAEQFNERRRRSLQDKVRNVLDGMKGSGVTTTLITARPYRFIYDADDIKPG